MQKLIPGLVLFVLALTSCLPAPTATHTPGAMPSPTAAVLPIGTSTSPSELIVIGPTAPIETFTTKLAQLEVKTFDGIELATLIDAGARGWKVVTDEKGQVQILVDRVGGSIFLAQGPHNFEWDEENLLWRGETGDGREIVAFPNVLLPGGWHEDTQTAGPWVLADKAFLIVDDNGDYWGVIHYLPDALQQLPREDNQIGDGICPPVMDKLQLAQALIDLPDGSGFCLQRQHVLVLDPGQHIELTAQPRP